MINILIFDVNICDVVEVFNLNGEVSNVYGIEIFVKY